MSSLEKTTQLAIELLKKQQITDYEVSLGKSSGVSTKVRLSEVETLQYHLDTNFDVNVYIGKKKGHASSVDLGKESLNRAIESACLIAKYTQEDPFNGLAPKERLAWQVPELDLYHLWDLDAKKSIDIAKECEAIALEQPEIDNSDGAEISSFEGESIYANSSGLAARAKSTRHSLHCSLIAKREEEMQTAYEYSVALDAGELSPAKQVGIEAARLAQQKLGSQNLSPQKCPILFTPRQSTGLFSQLLGALSGSRQYKKTSFLLESLGDGVLPETISVFEDPLQAKTIGAIAFDQDGVMKRRQFFVEDGRVSSYIMGQYSANQLGLESTANAGGVGNCHISPNYSGGFKELIKDMDRGLIVTDQMGHGVNMTTGDYSRGASGFWVESGEIKYPVSGITIAGNLKHMLANVVHVGDDIDPRSNIKVGTTLISEMTIAGEG
ncbi:MAG: metallopeptidase TldD-related protein [Candidatus Thioglobus sp.]|jgi:PmbA protein|nr:metallopeptidase TldD-related protein [Candidatus Thioglobus sp.]